mmetsp:Transcript_38331/g.92139  ORF Transcript_38331/g.92139 Transcript_38331/m.92139 type:complete len:290 (-) Transcript_38331:206-1075(-)
MVGAGSTTGNFSTTTLSKACGSFVATPPGLGMPACSIPAPISSLTGSASCRFISDSRASSLATISNCKAVLEDNHHSKRRPFELSRREGTVALEETRTSLGSTPARRAAIAIATAVICASHSSEVPFSGRSTSTFQLTAANSSTSFSTGKHTGAATNVPCRHRNAPRATKPSSHISPKPNDSGSQTPSVALPAQSAVTSGLPLATTGTSRQSHGKSLHGSESSGGSWGQLVAGYAIPLDPAQDEVRVRNPPPHLTEQAPQSVVSKARMVMLVHASGTIGSHCPSAQVLS